MMASASTAMAFNNLNIGAPEKNLCIGPERWEVKTAKYNKSALQ
jgi:hypothetical protein